MPDLQAIIIKEEHSNGVPNYIINYLTDPGRRLEQIHSGLFIILFKRVFMDKMLIITAKQKLAPTNDECAFVKDACLERVSIALRFDNIKTSNQL